jgi:hypothetical protein
VASARLAGTKKVLRRCYDMRPLSNELKHTQDHLAEAERHVGEGWARLRRQRERVADFEDRGQSAEKAKALLAQFEITLALQIEGRDRLRQELRGAS